MVRVQGLDHVAIAVKDVAVSRAWYQELLGLEERFRDVWHGDPTFLCAGESCIALIPSEKGGGDTGERHFAFRVDRANFDMAREALVARGIPFTFDDHTVSWGIYFQDPDGHTVELACYEVS